jgi:hypothetical protein
VPGALNFLIFVPTFTFLTLIYNTLPWIVPSFYHPAAVLVCIGIEILNFIFWLSGFAAIVAFIHGLRLCRGPVCTATQAAAAFSFLAMLGYAATTIGLSWWLYQLRKDMGVVQSVHVYQPDASIIIEEGRHRSNPQSPRADGIDSDWQEKDEPSRSPTRQHDSGSHYSEPRRYKPTCDCKERKVKCPHRRQQRRSRYVSRPWYHYVLSKDGWRDSTLGPDY